MTSGIVNVLKPPGMTSHDVVYFVRRVFSQKKVGHAGTLDPAAAGVLPVFIGSATRLIEYTANADKAYRVELTFGYATDTGDDTGSVIAADPLCGIPNEAGIAAILDSFVGEICQIPPMHSAIKIAGRKLYELAREGKTIERQARRITISRIAPVRIDAHVILFDVTCSKGTYIRSLCGDIGARAGCPAVMSFLVRTRVGGFTLDAAKSLEEIAAAPESALLPGDLAVAHLPRAALTADETVAFQHGRTVTCRLPADCGAIAVYAPNGRLAGIGKHERGSARLLPCKVFSQTP